MTEVTTVLLTLGRLPKGLEVARALHGAGCRVIVADPFRNHLSRPSHAIAASHKVTAPRENAARYVGDLLTIIAAEAVDLVIPVSEEVLYTALLADRLPPGVRLFCASPADVQALHDKFAFIQTAHSAGLAVPATIPAGEARASAFASEGESVLKPVFGCSGMGVHFLERGQAIPPALANDGYIIQRRVRGREISSLSVARNGQCLGTALYRGRIFAGSVATNFERVDGHSSVHDWISRFIAHTGHTGFIGFDIIIDDEGKPWPIECNPRLTSGVHFMDSIGLARAILDPDFPGPVPMKPQTAFQEGHTSLTKVYGSILRPRTFARRLAAFLSARDVLWSVRDPLPFVLMTPMSWDVLWPAMTRGMSFGEAATRDIEWQPDPASGDVPPSG